MIRLNLTAALLAALPLAAQGVVNDEALSMGQTLRLKISGVLGCYSLDALKRVSVLVMAQNGKATADQLNGEECRMFDTQHGEVIDAKDGAVCILGLGNIRCIWFPLDPTEPARR